MGGCCSKRGIGVAARLDISLDSVFDHYDSGKNGCEAFVFSFFPSHRPIRTTASVSPPEVQLEDKPWFIFVGEYPSRHPMHIDLSTHILKPVAKQIASIHYTSDWVFKDFSTFSDELLGNKDQRKQRNYWVQAPSSTNFSFCLDFLAFCCDTLAYPHPTPPNPTNNRIPIILIATRSQGLIPIQLKPTQVQMLRFVNDDFINPAKRADIAFARLSREQFRTFLTLSQDQTFIFRLKLAFVRMMTPARFNAPMVSSGM
eukprot:1262552-Amorphochlora_amoeboformis.AAC.2